MEFKGSKTEQNLLAGFAGESMARNKYTFFAGVAKREGYEQISALFMETAENERQHAKSMFQYLNGIGKTEDNLATAAYGEHEEWEVIYKKAGDVAKEEGFEEIAHFFYTISKIEKEHEERFLALLKNVKEDLVFKCGEETVWVCRNCGYVHTGKEAPKVCPACKHPQAFFERKAENY